MAASDDPLFLVLEGSGGREFRLLPARGAGLRRGSEDRYVLGAPQDPETNVAHPDLNDPNTPSLDANALTGVALRKGLEPIPNVRGLGEMDDRLQLASAEVELQVEGEPRPRRWRLAGPLWLGLICGLSASLARVE
jgi:hypothetical protein